MYQFDQTKNQLLFYGKRLDEKIKKCNLVKKRAPLTKVALKLKN